MRNEIFRSNLDSIRWELDVVDGTVGLYARTPNDDCFIVLEFLDTGEDEGVSLRLVSGLDERFFEIDRSGYIKVEKD